MVDNFDALFYCARAGGSLVRLYDGPDLKLFILFGWDRMFFVFCSVYRVSTDDFLLPQISSGVVVRDLQCHATRCICGWVLVFASS